MPLLTERQAQIAFLVQGKPGMSSSQIRKGLGIDISLVTIKRDIAALVENGYFTLEGSGRSVTYSITRRGRVLLPVDAHAYAAREPDMRGGSERFDLALFPDFPPTLFNGDELAVLERATETYRERSKGMSPTLHQKELERFVIELSWKSSRIEGNTYTLLDTERLIRDGVTAEGHAKDEATMILNHKKAFGFVREQKDAFSGKIGRATIEEVHRLLVDGLGVASGVRRGIVGITGSIYRPLDNAYQIDEALGSLYDATDAAHDVYTKALLLLGGISYIQPFEDGNKRTGRLSANGVLIASACAPLSYRNVDEVAYREALIVLYEVRSFDPLKRLFIEQYEFAATHYAGV